MAPESAAVIRAVVADDQAVVRAGIVAILDAEPDITVVGQAADGQAALRLVYETSPDVAVLDIRMPGLDGVAVAAAVLTGRPVTRIIMLTTFGLDEYVYTALRAGAAGFLLKDTEPEQLVTAVRTVVGGGALLDATLTRRLVDRFAPPRVPPRRPGSAVSPPANARSSPWWRGACPMRRSPRSSGSAWPR